jgi:hypothetical protein
LPQEFKNELQAERASATRLVAAERIFDTNVWQALEKRPVKEMKGWNKTSVTEVLGINDRYNH